MKAQKKSDAEFVALFELIPDALNSIAVQLVNFMSLFDQYSMALMNSVAIAPSEHAENDNVQEAPTQTSARVDEESTLILPDKKLILPE